MSKMISIILFAVCIAVIPVLSLFAPYQTISVQENRVLASFPVFNLEEVTSKRFMTGCVNFVSDHIVLRVKWTAV